jgi:hypothetical protein
MLPFGSPASSPAREQSMSSPIGFREFSEDEYRKFIQTLSNEELIKAGKRLRSLCGDVVLTTPSAFQRQLKICREEYRRRHPK